MNSVGFDRIDTFIAELTDMIFKPAFDFGFKDIIPVIKTSDYTHRVTGFYIETTKFHDSPMLNDVKSLVLKENLFSDTKPMYKAIPLN